jgi:6,7-dimethyl-8-ribityllumazine synthase
MNKGGGAAAAALHLVALSRRWARRGKAVGFTRAVPGDRS